MTNQISTELPNEIFPKQSISPETIGQESKDKNKLSELLQAKKPNPKSVIDLYQSTSSTSIKLEVSSILLTLSLTEFEGILPDIIIIFRAELGSSLSGSQAYFMAAILERLSSFLNSNNALLRQDIKQLLNDFRNHSNDIIRLAIQHGLGKKEVQNTDFKNQIEAILFNKNPTLQTISTPSSLPKGFTEKNSAAYRTVKGDGIELKLSNSSRDTTGLITLVSGMVAQTFGGSFKMGFTSAIVQSGNLPPMFIVAPVVEYLLGRLTRLKDTRNLYKFAIVTDSVASIHKDDRPNYLRMIDHRHNFAPESFIDSYQSLIDEGYQRIISLHLSPKLSRSFEYAKQAAKQFKDQAEIKVINSHANGLGLGLMIQEINMAIINHYSPIDVYYLIQSFIHKIHYYVIPLSFNYVKNQGWVRKISDQAAMIKIRMFQFKPVITLDESIKLLDSFSDNDKAIAHILHQIEKEQKKRPKKIKRIGIEYRRCSQRAMTLSNRLKLEYPQTKVSVHVAGSITNALFGPDLIGVCIF